MTAAVSHRRLALVVAAVMYAAVAIVFGLVPWYFVGVANFFYLPVALVAVVTRPSVGVAAGAAAAALYFVGVVVHPEIPSADALTLGTVIRLVTYGTTGGVIGWFAQDNRRLVEELRILAERDGTTGLPNTRAFESAIQRRLDAGTPFGLLIGDLARLADDSGDEAVDANDALIQLADSLGNSLAPGDELARVGGREFAILADLGSTVEATRLARRLEHILGASGIAMRFGWAVFPQEGQNALSLYRAADERLYARKLVAEAGRSTAVLRSVS